MRNGHTASSHHGVMKPRYLIFCCPRLFPLSVLLSPLHLQLTIYDNFILLGWSLLIHFAFIPLGRACGRLTILHNFVNTYCHTN